MLVNEEFILLANMIYCFEFHQQDLLEYSYPLGLNHK